MVSIRRFMTSNGGFCLTNDLFTSLKARSNQYLFYRFRAIKDKERL